MAANQSGLRDEDGQSSDWIELYNAGPNTVDLGGWHLTDSQTEPTKWRFPSTNLGAYSFLVVFASEKDRTNPGQPLHTNFKLDADGEFLALIWPDGVTFASGFTPSYPAQTNEISYGRLMEGRTVLPNPATYLSPTPGNPNGTGVNSGVQFSVASGTFTTPFELLLSPPSSNAVVRYLVITNAGGRNLTNVPSVNSPIYSGPIPIRTTTQVRAQAFATDTPLGTPSTMTYLQIDSSLRQFSSDRPLVLMATFGATLASSGDRPAYLMLFDSVPDRTVVTNRPVLATRIGVNDRGSSTANQSKNNMSVELWDEFGEHADKPFLDMPPESDWVFYGGFFYKDRGKTMEVGPPWDCDRCLGTGGAANVPQGDNRVWNPRIWRNYAIDVGNDQGTDFFGRSTVGVHWFDRLFRDPDFWQTWIDRYQQLRTNMISDERVIDMVESFYQEIKEAQVREQARWAPPPLGRERFNWPRAGLQSITTSAGGFSSTYAYDFGPTNPLSATTKVGYFTNEVRHQKQWLLDRLNFIDTNFLDMPRLTVGPGPAPNTITVSMQSGEKAGTLLLYTLDGSDPRLPGGAIAPTAQTHAGDLTLPLPRPVRLFARCYNTNHANITNAILVGNPPINSFWSGPATAIYHAQVPLALTEVMYHPAAPTASAARALEFIELKNLGLEPLDLSGFVFTNGIRFTFPSNFVLNARAYTLLAGDRAACGVRYGSNLPIAGEFASSTLDNDGERLTLVGRFGESIVDLHYDPAWARATDGHGFSLVPVAEDATQATCRQAARWRASARQGGSPGAPDPVPLSFVPVVINEVLSHAEPPFEDAVELFNPSASPAGISGWYLTDDFGDPRKYRIPDGTAIPAGEFLTFDEHNFNNPDDPSSRPFAFSAAGDDAYLFSADAEGNLTGYVHGFRFGGARANTSFGRHVTSVGAEQIALQAEPSFYAPNSGPKVGSVVISKVFYHPPGWHYSAATIDNRSDEYVELCNISTRQAALHHPTNLALVWQLAKSIEFAFPPGTVLEAGARLVVVPFDPNREPARLAAWRARWGISESITAVGPWVGSLPNDQGRIEVREPIMVGPAPDDVAHVVVDGVTYSNLPPWPVTADGPGDLLQRLTPVRYADDPAHWAASTPRPFPRILEQPRDVTLRGSTNQADCGFTTNQATFSVLATGPGSPTYQWRFNGSELPDATNATLTLLAVGLPHDGLYDVVVRGETGSAVSAPARLKVLVSPTFLQPPLDQLVPSNSIFSVSAVIRGNPPPFRYEWRNLSTPLLTNITANTTNFFIYGPVTNVIPRPFRVVVFNEAGPSSGLLGQFTVTALADSEGDGLPDDWETQVGLNPTNRTDAELDLDGDTLSNRAEYLAGTDPNDPASFLKVDQLVLAGEPMQTTVRFGAVSDRTYTLEVADSALAGPWSRLADVPAASTNRVVAVSDPGATNRPQRFYRVATPRVP